MGIISLINGKKGKLYLKFIVAVAIIAAAIYAYSVAANPTSTPIISKTNRRGTLLGSAQIANASVAQYKRRCCHA